MELKTYYDFANDDYKLFSEICNLGIEANSIGALAQSICERYIKHLIDTYIEVNDNNSDDVTSALKTHNVNRLMDFWNSNSNHKFSNEEKEKIGEINGYYFSTRYPGDDAVMLTKEDIDQCRDAVDKCKAVVDRIIIELQ